MRKSPIDELWEVVDILFSIGSLEDAELKQLTNAFDRVNDEINDLKKSKGQ